MEPHRTPASTGEEALAPRPPRLRSLARRAWAGLRGIDPVLCVALAVGLALRAWAFGALPPGLNQDEASTAYDAYSLVHFGVDRHGFHLPVVLVSWGSGMYALAAYVAAPFIAAFGLEVWTARLPHLLAGLASIPLLYVLLRDAVDRRTARAGALLLAISPWHVMISRWALDSNLLPFVFLLATVLLVRSRRRPWLLPAAALTYALTLYAYGTAYVVTPVFLALCLVHGLRHRLWPLRAVVGAAAAFLVVALPIALFLAVNTFGWRSIETPLFTVPRLTGVPRFQTMGNVHVLSAGFVGRAAENLAHGLGLLRSQDDGLAWNAIPGFGILYWFSTVLAVIGLALVVERCLGRRLGGALRPGLRRRAAAFPLLAWCLASLALLAFVDVNVNRANVAMIPFVSCAAVAVAHLWRRRSIAVLLCLLFSGSLVGFTRAYFGPYREAIAGPFFASFGEAIRHAAAQTRGQICVTDDVNMPYVFVLFFNREDPRTFRLTAHYRNPGAEFEQVDSFGRWRFGLGSCADTAGVLVATPAEAAALPRERFTVREFERYVVLTRR